MKQYIEKSIYGNKSVYGIPCVQYLKTPVQNKDTEINQDMKTKLNVKINQDMEIN